MILRFGIFEFDRERAELCRHGRVLPIQEKPLTVLEALLAADGEVVDRETLRRRLWPDGRHVDVDGGINAAVRRLREVLDDSASNPRFVATVPRRGYRFVAPIARVSPEDPPGSPKAISPTVETSSAPARASLDRRIVVPAIAGLFLLLGLGLFLLGRQSVSEPPETASYLEGRYFQNRLTERDLRLAEEAFRAAAAEAPDDDAPYAALAEVWILRGLQDFVPTSEAFPKARQAAREALSRDPDSAAVVSLALAEHLYAWNPAGAAPLYARALQVDPASASTLLFASAFESDRGNHRRAVELAERAVKLAPLSPAVHTELCRRLFEARRHDAAVERCRRASELDPDFLEAWDVLKWIHIHRRDDARAVEAFLRVVELEEVHKDALPLLRADAEEGGIKALLRRSLDDPARRLAESGQSPYNLALDTAALGRLDAAFRWLDEAFLARETDLASLGSDPRLDVLREDPRFDALVERIAAGEKPPSVTRNPEDSL